MLHVGRHGPLACSTSVSGGDERQYGLLDENNIISQSRGNRRTRRDAPQPGRSQVVLLVGAIGIVVPQPWASVVTSITLVDLLETPTPWRTFAFA